MAVVCLSICLSVSPVSDHKSWMEGRSKQKIGKKDHGWPNIFSQLVHWSRPYYEHIAIRIIIIELSFAFYANKQQLCVRKSSALQAGLSQPQNKDCITSEGILLQFNIRKTFNFIITLSNHTTILLMKYFKNWSQLYRLRRQLHDPTDETWRKVISVEDMWWRLNIASETMTTTTMTTSIDQMMTHARTHAQTIAGCAQTWGQRTTQKSAYAAWFF